MKQVSLKKLFLNKVTVASLESIQLNQVKGGQVDTYKECITSPSNCCYFDRQKNEAHLQ